MSPWRRTLAGAALFKLAAGVLAALSTLAFFPEMRPTRLPVMTLYVVAFGLAAGLLSVGARANRAGRELGMAYLLIATAFAQGAIAWAPESLALARPLVFFDYLQLDAFLPFLFWRFAGAFPDVTLLGGWRRTLRLGTLVSLWTGFVLFALNLLMYAGRAWPPLSEAGPLALFRRASAGYYWPILYLLLFGALVFGLLKTRKCPPEDRRRSALFVGSVALGSAPVIAAGLLSLVWPRFARAFLETGPEQVVILSVLDIFLLSIPFTSAYAVLVHRVIPLQSLLRRAIRYALARYSLVGATAVPFVVAAGLLYRRRDQTLDSLFSGPSLLVLGSLVGIGVAGLRWRAQWLTAVDRRFFRERYDARQILLSLADNARQATSLTALSGLLREEIDRALHLTTVEVLIRYPGSPMLRAVGDRLRPLAAGSELARRARDAGAPIEFDPEEAESEVEELTQADRYWLVDGGFRVLVPLLGSNGELVGLVALGEKRSGLPFSAEDLQLLAGISAATSLRLELASSIPGVSQAATAGEGEWAPGQATTATGSREAQECARCGHIEPASGQDCSRCGGPAAPGELPPVLAGKFRFDSRIGAGGMGVVYRATDLDLNRPVAIKSLPSMSARKSMRFRREARAMAAVSHPNLALIYGAESWRGRPLLVFEYLAGGDLARRIGRGPLPVAEALAIARAMADVVRKIHSHRILHRDIKPSNIGFTEEGMPKLLDFGLAKLLLETPDPAEPPEVEDDDETTQYQTVMRSQGGRYAIIGTVPYLSPEALAGGEPDYSFDLWSLAVVLFECVAGINPFLGATRIQTIGKIQGGKVPDLTKSVPDCPPDLARFLARALAPDPRHRLSSARDFGDALDGLASRVA